MTPGTRVPDDVFKPMTDTDRTWLRTVPEADRRLSSSEILGRWRAQASQAGFGPVEVQNVFDSAHRLGRSLRAQSQVLTSDTFGAIWDAMTRTGAREHHRDRHGPEHGPAR